MQMEFVENTERVIIRFLTIVAMIKACSINNYRLFVVRVSRPGLRGADVYPGGKL
jgi:hypothetical protein